MLLLLVTSCSSEAGCFTAAGATVTYEIAVDDFNAINISEGIALIIKEGAERKVVVETGENIKDNVNVIVESGKLNISNNSGCNWVRDYNSTTVFVTTPHLEEIYSSSQFSVRSEGILTFPNLSLKSGLYAETASGTFELEIACESLSVQDNQSIFCKISGIVENLNINFYAGDARFEGSGLVAQKVNIFHRSSNDIIINPQQEITGTLYSTGNLVLKNIPPVITVEQLYTGTIIYP